VSRASAPWRQTGRIAHLRSRRIFAVSLALGLALAGGIPTATAGPDASGGVSHDKVFVCKYVGQPKVDERLQTGDNPIDVSVSTIRSFDGLRSYFGDSHDQSFVLAWADKGVSKPPITDCPAPRGPEPRVTTSSEHSTTCTEYKVRDITVTTPYVWNADGDKWVLDTTASTPVVGDWVVTNTPPTAEQLRAAHLFCASQPPAEVVVTTEQATTCAEYKVRDITVTTPYVWNADGDKWVLDTTASTPVVGDWVKSTPTAEQLRAAELVCPIQPSDKVVVTTEQATTCAEYKVRDITVTTPYVWNADGDKWVLDTTASTPVVGDWVVANTPPTDAQIKAAGLTCSPPVDNPPVDNPPVDNPPVDNPPVDNPPVDNPPVDNPPVDNPPVDNPVVVVTESSGGVQIEAAKPVVVVHAAPVVTETTDGVQIAAAHPLPSAARAGEASTGGQLTAGGFAALAALLAFGAAFVLRRRHGDA
jgi:hypothetical protein